MLKNGYSLKKAVGRSLLQSMLYCVMSATIELTKVINRKTLQSTRDVSGKHSLFPFQLPKAESSLFIPKA